MISDYGKMYDSMMFGKSKPNHEKSFKAWQEDAAVTRKAFAAVTKVHEDEIARILKEYSTSKASEMLAEAQSKYMECRKFVEDDLKSKLEAVIASKREMLRKANSAPSEADLRLLQALKMRSKISESDIAHAAESLGNSLVSLATLADIANAHGIYISVPTADKFEEQMDQAVSYANKMINELHLPDKELSYPALEFYNHPDVEKGFSYEAFNDLDNSVFTAEQAKKIVANTFDPKTMKENYGATRVKLAGGNPNATEVKLTGDESIQNIAYQFDVKLADLEKANAGRDIFGLAAGDTLIVPSGKMKMISGRGFIRSEQCEPIEIST